MAARGLELLRRVPMVLTILKRLSLSLVLVGLATLGTTLVGSSLAETGGRAGTRELDEASGSLT